VRIYAVIPRFGTTLVQKNTTDSRLPSALPDWNGIRYFLEVARLGTLSAAARALDVEHTTVARRIATLEQHLGLHLFDRLPQAWRLTCEGESLVPYARRLEEEALALAHAAHAHGTTSGPVRVSAPPIFASRFLLPRLAPALALAPAIQLQLLGEAREANLARREADIALRLGRPADERLAGRPLANVGYGFYAHPRWGEVAEVDWRFLRHGDEDGGGDTARCLREFAAGRSVAFASNDLLILCEAACAGLGVALLPHFLARDDRRLVALASGWGVQRPLWLAIHPEVRRSPRVAWASGLIGDTVMAAASELV